NVEPSSPYSASELPSAPHVEPPSSGSLGVTSKTDWTTQNALRRRRSVVRTHQRPPPFVATWATRRNAGGVLNRAGKGSPVQSAPATQFDSAPRSSARSLSGDSRPAGGMVDAGEQ